MDNGDFIEVALPASLTLHHAAMACMDKYEAAAEGLERIRVLSLAVRYEAKAIQQDDVTSELQHAILVRSCACLAARLAADLRAYGLSLDPPGEIRSQLEDVPHYPEDTE